MTTSTAAAEIARPRLSHRQILLLMGGLMTGMLLAALDQTIVGTALPTIVGELGGINHYSWVVTAYLLASTASTPLYGKISDLYGRRPVLLFAIMTFLVGSLLAGASQNMTELIVIPRHPGSRRRWSDDAGVHHHLGRRVAPRAWSLHGHVRRGVRPLQRGRSARRRLLRERHDGGDGSSTSTCRSRSSPSSPCTGVMRLVPHKRRDHKVDWLGRRADGRQRRVACCSRCPWAARRAGSGVQTR